GSRGEMFFPPGREKEVYMCTSEARTKSKTRTTMRMRTSYRTVQAMFRTARYQCLRGGKLWIVACQFGSGGDGCRADRGARRARRFGRWRKVDASCRRGD